MPPRRLLLLMLLLTATAGCGGKGHLLDLQVPGVREAWVARANGICADRAAAVRRLPTPRTQAELIDSGARIISIEDLEYARLARTRPPAGDREDLSDFLESIRRVQRGIERVRAAVGMRSGADLPAARAELVAARRDSNANAHELGLTCRH
jgi:hypothetical protein